MAVASNKFQAGTEKLVRLFFPEVEFAAVFGQRPDVPLNLRRRRREILALTARPKNACCTSVIRVWISKPRRLPGVRSAGVTWGFRDREELVAAGARHLVDRPDELLELL